MFTEAKLFLDELEKKEMHGSLIDESENKNIVRVGFSMKATKIEILVIFEPDGHIGIRCFDFMKVTEDQFPAALMCCNDLNKGMRWVKFYIDDDGDINLEDDAILDPNSAGEEVFELVMRMAIIADEAYPTINKAIWGAS